MHHVWSTNSKIHLQIQVTAFRFVPSIFGAELHMSGQRRVGRAVPSQTSFGRQEADVDDLRRLDFANAKDIVLREMSR